ncbi:MAG TPA: hypothetical protein VEX15_15030 [Nocardioidaceae bacterium]|nr:hypothetical protein [Nocardioidaceae bacterium]
MISVTITDLEAARNYWLYIDPHAGNVKFVNYLLRRIMGTRPRSSRGRHGLRWGECLGLRLDTLALESDVVDVRRVAGLRTVPINDAQGLLGHERPSTRLDLYTHY